MKEQLLWSWTSENAENHIQHLPLSVTAEKYISILFLTLISAIMVLYIAPLLGTWAIFTFIIIYIALIPYTLKNYKNRSLPTEKQFIHVYNNRISVNYYGYKGSYQLSNINLDSIIIKYIVVGTMAGASVSNALCFEIKSPKMQLKVPLPVLEPSLSELKNALKVLTRRSNGTSKQQLAP